MRRSLNLLGVALANGGPVRPPLGGYLHPPSETKRRRRPTPTKRKPFRSFLSLMGINPQNRDAQRALRAGEALRARAARPNLLLAHFRKYVHVNGGLPLGKWSKLTIFPFSTMWVYGSSSSPWSGGGRFSLPTSSLSPWCIRGTFFSGATSSRSNVCSPSMATTSAPNAA